MKIKPLLIHIKETDSTNKYLRKISELEKLVSGSIVLADYQSDGRGISGSYWESERGKNLTFSVLYYPMNLPSNRPFVIAEMASLSVKYTLDKYLHDVTVKWPNDIYYGDNKITGILIENTVYQGCITQSIIGIGLNVNQTIFRSNAPNAISMAQITGFAFDRLGIMNDFRQTFAEQNIRIDNRHYAAIHNDYLKVLYHKTGFHSFIDAQGAFKASILDIEPSGHLVLERKDGYISRYAFKEVSFF